MLGSLPDGIFEGLTALTELRLGGNTTNPMLLTVSLEKVGDNQFKAVASIGAPFAIVLPVSATNGSISGDATTLTISKGSVESDAVTVTRTEGTTAAVTVNIGTLPAIPNDHYGYNLSKSDALPVEIISEESTPTIPSGADEIDTATPAITPPPVTPVTPDPPDEVPENNAPTFTEGAVTKRSVAENTAANTNIGTAVSATDSDSGDTLSYTLGGVDAASFDIDSATGQLKTKAALDYETKRVYAVSITVSDGSLTDTISVIISVINKADTVLDTSILSVNDRTSQVRDAIVAAVPGVTAAADVTATHLSAITSLDLRSKDISALKSGDFSGLSSMTSLNLYGNLLSSFPDGIFAGLTSLTSLRLGGNTVNPMPLIVWLEQVSNDMYKVSIPTGAPFDVAVPVVLVDGEIGETLRLVTIPKGSVKSDAFLVPVVQSGSIVIGALPNLPSNHFGYVLTKSGACNLTPQVAAAITAVVPGVTDCRNLSETDLATITSLNLNNKSVTSLLSSDFAGMFSLTSLDLRNNQLSSLPDGIFSGLTGLTTLQLSGNTVDPFPLTVSLEKVGTNMVRATLPTGAPFDLTLPITVANGSLAGSVSNLMIAAGSVDSAAVVVLRASNAAGAVTANIDTLPSLPATHNGYALVKSTALPLEIFRRINIAPVFTESITTTRSIAESTQAGTNIGTAIAATDANTSDTLTYTLTGTDASSFAIVSTSGQLQTKSALNYERKNSYTVTVSVSDGNGGSDSITVTINITNVLNEGTQQSNVNVAPVFTAGTTTTRSIAENTAADTNIGTAIAATDANTSDTLTYTLTGTDASSFAIVSTSGQLQTKSALNYERKNSYTVTVSVSDGNGGSNTITVTITITDVVENVAPVFTDGATTTRSIAENTAAGTNIGTAVSATDVNTSDTLTYTLTGTDANSFAIVSTSGQLQTKSALNYERKNSYTVTVSVSDGNGGSDSITVTINITNVLNEGTQQSNVNVAPVFTDGATITRSIAENTAAGTNIGTAVSATDANTSDTLTYTLTGTDANLFSIVSTSGQLQTKSALNYERKNSYTVTVSVSDGNGGSDSITVTINITNVVNKGTQQSNVNVAPVFTAGTTTTRSIAENTAADTNIGSAISATDANSGDTLSYTLSGADASSFSIVSTSGQLQAKAALDYETKSSYTVTITVSDGTATDSITVTINVTDVDENRAPVFTAGTTTTRSIAENTATGVNIGTTVSATDADSDTLTYSLGETDAASFSIVSTSGQLQTKSALNYELKNSYSVTITVSDGNGGTDSVIVTINVLKNTVPELFWIHGDPVVFTVDENTAAGVNIGTNNDSFRVYDPDVDTHTFSIGGTDAASFDINSTTRRLKTKAPLDYETKSSYFITVTVSDGRGGSDTIPVTIIISDVNEAPVFSDGSTATRSVVENVDARTNIGSVVGATDPEGKTLTYTLGGTDAASFTVSDTTGQLKTKATLDYETKSSYSVTITVSDGKLTDTITVTINVTDLNEVVTSNAPVFTDGETATRSVAENTPAGTNIGTAIAATDADVNTTLNYLLSGTDAASFSIDNSTEQLQTSAALDYETKASYEVTITVSDGRLKDTITVTINVTDVNDAPVFVDKDTIIRNVKEDAATGANIGAPISATDQDNDTLTYSLGGTDAASFMIDTTNGQLKIKAALDYETKTLYSVTINVTDDADNSLTDTIVVTINVTNVHENSGPAFTERPKATRSIAENTGSGANIGAPISAADADNVELTYTLVSFDSASFDIDSSTGQLRTKAALDYETKNSYLVQMNVSDGEFWDRILVRISVTNVNEVTAFTEGDSTTRSIAENTAAGVNIGSAVSAIDEDGDELTYTLGGTDAAAFDIIGTSGQLQTKADLNYETKISYTVTVTAADGNGGSDTITVTINVTNVTTEANIAPVFTEGDTATRSVTENTPAGTNIGTPVSATDADSSDTLTYTLSGTDAASFSIVNSSGQLQTKAALDYETKTSYTVIVTVSDSKTDGADTITVTINVTDVTGENRAPVFTEGDTATRSAPEASVYLSYNERNTYHNIGHPIAATDEDDDALTYSFFDQLPPYFSIDSATGQLSGGFFNYEFQSSYTVTLKVTDGRGGSDTITVTVNITDVNEKPAFTNSTDTIYVDERIGINRPYTATDPDGDTITYMLGGTDADLFTLDNTTGQLQTNAPLDPATKQTYTVIITATDEEGLTDTITVTINIVPPPNPAVITRTHQVRQAIVSALSGVNSASDVNSAHLSSITSLNLSSKSITSLSTGDFNGLINLIKLNLSVNNLTSLPDDIFDELTSLEYFHINYNQLSALNGDLFENNTSLREIDLTDNNLSSFPDGIFEGLTSISTLWSSQLAEALPIVLSIVLVDDNDSNVNAAKFKVTVHTGAPYDMTVAVFLNVLGFLSHYEDVTISAGSLESDVISIERSDDVTLAILIDLHSSYITTKPGYHYGYYFAISEDLPLEVIAAVVNNGNAPTTFSNGPPRIPKSTVLLPNFPNPFNPETWIPYQLAKPSNVSITIYDIRGNVVRRLNLGHQKAGFYTNRSRAAHWDGRNKLGERVANGVYFYLLKAGDYAATRKMLILK